MSLDSNSEKTEGFFKIDNFINDIAFRASLCVFCDLNKYIVIFLGAPIMFF